MSFIESEYVVDEHVFCRMTLEVVFKNMFT